MIRTPFNFVPLSDEVFFPDWADKVSHDKPMTDSENNLDSLSGEIDITIEAKSPIFIADSKEKEKFCQYKGQYYIPSSSVKGMTRGIVEILSFSKMSVDTYNDNTYSVRDLNNKKVYMDNIGKTRHCGWLYKDGDNYKIIDCKEPYRVSYDEIEKEFNIKGFKERFLIAEESLKHDERGEYITGNFDNTKSPLKKAEEKYKLLKLQDSVYTTTFEFVHILTDTPGERKIAKFKESCTSDELKKGLRKGKLVLTGHPTARKEPLDKESTLRASGKIYDFIFEDLENPATYTIGKDDDIIKNFKFAYFDDRKTEPKESPDWTFWKQKLENGEKIPVFFPSEGGIRHFGLSYLYKLPYSHSVMQGTPPSHKDERLDLAQTIFGYAKDKDALKGRAYFSHFVAKKNQALKELFATRRVLGTPRASYYPIYIKQHGKEYKTFMDSDFQIAGRKRYPIHKNFNNHISTEEKEILSKNKNIGTTFTPLSQGAVFNGKLRYHNLKKAELGAILSALTFHNTPNTFHNIGLAKSLGYGKIKIIVKDFPNLKEYLEEFEISVTQRVLDWKSSSAITELLTMATEQNNDGESKLAYMELSQFAAAKNQQNYLKIYSKLNGIKAIHVKSLISDLQMQEVKLKHQEILENEKRVTEEREERLKHDRDWSIVSKTTNTDDIENFLANYPNTPFAKMARKKLNDLKKQLEEDKAKREKEERKRKLLGYLKESNLSKKRELLGRYIEDYSSKYPDCNYVKQAKEELSTIDTQSKINISLESGINTLLQADNPNRFINVCKKYATSNQNKISQEEKVSIMDKIVDLFSSVNAKTKRNFFKKSNIDKLLGREDIQSLKDKLNI